MSNRRILVTSALPYANGHIHLGHMVEYLMTDIWVRYQRLQGNDCRYFCADDTHGTAIMVRARKEGRKEEEMIAEMSASHQRDFAGFGIHFDHYGSTNADSNKELCGQVWQKIRDAGLVIERHVERLFDPEAGSFLADRFVKGTCPKCGSVDQYGDSCDRCGATYAATELKNPYSTLSGATPEPRESLQLFVQIEKLHDFLNDWTQNGEHLQPEISNYLKGHFLGEPLRDWDVSRPAPYFGFAIPDAPGNFWYVWFDAPIGYMASLKDWCDKTGEDFQNWWPQSHKAAPEIVPEIHHYIGKDITYFHTLFWPAMLKAAGYQLPEKVHIHGFLTVDGEKMSKSKGTFIHASTYLKHLDPNYLRYFYASKLSPKVDDIDLSFDEFVNKINSDLVGKLVNLASRTAKFIKDIGLSEVYPDDDGLFEAAAQEGDNIAKAYEDTDFSLAMRQIMALADRANEFVEKAEPWTLKKDPSKQKELQDSCTIALNLFRQLVIYMTPVLPQINEKVGELFGQELHTWEQSKTPLINQPINKFKHLLQRVDIAKIQSMIDDSTELPPEKRLAINSAEVLLNASMKDKIAAANKNAASKATQKQAKNAPKAPSTPAKPTDSPTLKKEPLAEQISFDDFMKVDLRVAEILEAHHVEGADKLLCLKLGLGGTETRQVFAGIKSAYKPEDLTGRKVICVANLAPRKMKFGMSEGMVIAAGPGGEDIYLLSPDDGAEAGQRVH